MFFKNQILTYLKVLYLTIMITKFWFGKRRLILHKNYRRGFKITFTAPQIVF